MKISLDLDGTIYANMEFFREFMKAMQASGHRVGILTGHSDSSEEHDRKKLEEFGFPSPDFYFGRTQEYIPFNGAKFKSMIIQREEIDIHFDDYDFWHPETIKIFSDLGQEDKIIRMNSRKQDGEPKEK